MKIAIYSPKAAFSDFLVKRLSSLGEIIFSDTSQGMSDNELIKLAQGAEIIAPDPDNFGGFEKAKPRLTKVMETLPNLRGVCLSTTSFGWIDTDYCKKRKVPISNVPGYSGESVAEHALALMLNLAKNILISDRRYQKGRYKLQMGFELRGKTLGIIGLGNIGSRVAQLGMGIGMKVIACNRSPKTMAGVEMTTFEEVLKKADVISLHTTHEKANKNLIGQKQIALIKPGAIIVNTVDRELVDEAVMAEALKSGKVYGYALEAEDLEHGPLSGVENAILIKGFGWYTREALENLYQIWADNIQALAKGKPQNLIY